MDQGKKEKKPRRRRLTEGIRSRVRETVGLGTTLVNEPKSFPGEIWRVVKRALRRLWNARGGGLYACGFVVAFVWLEITTLADDFSSSTGVTGFFSGQLLQFLLRFTIDSMVNTVLALIWPVQVLAYSPPWGALSLGAMYLAFPYILKRPLERWLFDDAGAVAEEPPAENPVTGKDKE